MLQAYIAAGFAPEAFWSLTPRLYLVHMRGARARLEAEYNARAWQAWHTAYLPRLEKPIALDELQLGEAITQEPMSQRWQDSCAAWVAYANYKAKTV